METVCLLQGGGYDGNKKLHPESTVAVVSIELTGLALTVAHVTVALCTSSDTAKCSQGRRHEFFSVGGNRRKCGQPTPKIP